MDGFLIGAIIVAVLAAIVALISRASRKDREDTDAHNATIKTSYDRESYSELASAYPGLRATKWVLFGLTALFFALSCFVVVQPRHEGIEVTLGKSGASYSNGFHLKNPLAKVKKYDGTLQTEKYTYSDKGDAGDQFSVRLENGSTMYLDVTYAYRLGSDISPIYRDYPTKDTKDFNGLLVHPQIQLALNELYGTYDPYAAVRAQAANAGATTNTVADINPSDTYVTYAQKALDIASTNLAKRGIDLVTITISQVWFDTRTTGLINDLSASVVNTQKAIQDQATAKAQAETNKLIAASPPTTEQNIQECLKQTAANPQAYAGMASWNCFGGTGVQITKAAQ